VELSAKTLQLILDSATDTAIITLNRDGLILSWNAGARRILGWSEDEMIGQTPDRLFREEDLAAGVFKAEIKAASEHGKGGQEGWRIRKDGARIWAIGETSPIRGGDGSIEGFVKVLRDRTPWKQAEDERLEENRIFSILNRVGSSLSRERNLETLVQNVTDAGVELTYAEFGAFFYNVLNDAGESYLLYTLSGAPRSAFERFAMPRNTAVFGPTFSGEGIVRSDDITKDPRYGKNAPHFGMPKGHLSVRSYLAVSVLSRSGEVIGGLFFGHSKPGVFTERSERGLTSLAAEAGVAIDNARLDQSRNRAEAALRELNASLELQVAERTRQLQQQEEALRQSQKMEAIGQLTGGIAHDFNNLLQVIIGNLETISRALSPDSPRLQRAAANAMKGAKRAAGLTERLLAFSRRSPLDPKPVDINTLVHGLTDLMQQTLGEIIEIETVCAAGAWRVEVDINAFEASLINLAVNSRDAMPNGGKLTIETSNAYIDSAYAELYTEVRPGQYVAVAVSDTGTGMDATTLARAFEPFFTTKAVGAGTGLGLSQVYGFVKQSGGHVKVYSEIDQGTTVKIYLPRYVGEMSEDAGAETLTPEGAKSETILVVEDDVDVRAYSVDCLSELGYRVLEASDGVSALNIIRRQLQLKSRIDLLFTDVVLPKGMTGAQIAREAGELIPDLKVLFTTGYARNAIFHHGRLDKGVALITKPFTFSDLAARVRDILDGL
jgi:PAS domain S-box-containing protein